MSFGAVDIGNSTIKIYELGPDINLVSCLPDVREAVATCRRRGIDRVAFCTTRELSGSERLLLENEGWWELKFGVSLPLQIEYDTPETLGPDRVAAAIGAWSLFSRHTDLEKAGKAVLVADAGTALTLDVVGLNGTFRGGNISPGFGMRLAALHEFTSRLPMVGLELDMEGYWGKDTSTAILAGCSFGLLYEVIGAARTARRDFECETIVFTGGDAEGLLPDLLSVNHGEFKVEYVAELVAVGLKTAYDFNHE